MSSFDISRTIQVIYPVATGRRVPGIPLPLGVYMISVWRYTHPMWPSPKEQHQKTNYREKHRCREYSHCINITFPLFFLLGELKAKGRISRISSPLTEPYDTRPQLLKALSQWPSKVNRVGIGKEYQFRWRVCRIIVTKWSLHTLRIKNSADAALAQDLYANYVVQSRNYIDKCEISHYNHWNSRSFWNKLADHDF